jgi:hypothetical protein
MSGCGDQMGIGSAVIALSGWSSWGGWITRIVRTLRSYWRHSPWGASVPAELGAKLGLPRSTRPRPVHPGGWGAERTEASCPGPGREATITLCQGIAAGPRPTRALNMK